METNQPQSPEGMIVSRAHLPFAATSQLLHIACMTTCFDVGSKFDTIVRT